MRQFDECGADRGRSDLVRLDRLRPLHRGPTIVAPLLDAMDRFPKLPTDIADEQLACLAVEAHPPGVAEAKRPNLRPRPLHADERIILRDAILLSARLVAIHVDPQDRGEEIGNILPRFEGVGRVRVGGVAGGDVEHAIGTEVDVAAVVPALEEGEHDLLAGRVDARRIGIRDAEPGDARPVGQVALPGLRALKRVADEAGSILLEIGVKRQTIHRLDLLGSGQQGDRLDLGSQIEKQLGLGVRRVGEGIQHAGLFADIEPIASGTASHEQGMIELQIRKRPNNFVRWRRIGRTDDSRSRPSGPGRRRRRGLRWLGRQRSDQQNRQHRRGEMGAVSVSERSLIAIHSSFPEFSPRIAPMKRMNSIVVSIRDLGAIRGRRCVKSSRTENDTSSVPTRPLRFIRRLQRVQHGKSGRAKPGIRRSPAGLTILR